MGVNLRDIAEQQDVSFESLAGKTVAIDALNSIFQFLSTIRDRFTGEPLKDSKGGVTSHLSGLFYRTSRLVEAGMTPVFIFDGKAPDFKATVQAERRKARAEAKAKWEQAVRDGDTAKVRLYSQQASELDEAMLGEAKRLLDAMGIQWIQAPTEGEAEAAYLSRSGAAYACGSQDWDSLLFGARRLLRNLAITGKRKLPGKESYVIVSPQMVELDRMLGALGISHGQLIIIGILSGTDFNPGGVRGFGPKKALDLVREHRTLDAVLKHVSWEFPTPAQTIFDFFSSPPVADVELRPGKPDPDAIRRILIDGHDFSEERIKGALEKLESSGSRKQSGLGRFF